MVSPSVLVRTLLHRHSASAAPLALSRPESEVAGASRLVVHHCPCVELPPELHARPAHHHPRAPTPLRPNSNVRRQKETVLLPTLKFLHSMRERSFLESALSEGLMLRDHTVQFSPAKTHAQWQALLGEEWSLLMTKLNSLGAPWGGLSEERKNLLMGGIGSISGKIPMLCFTEVPEGRGLSFHHLSFGGYGLVVSRNWLESNGGDRVIYAGNNSSESWPASRSQTCSGNRKAPSSLAPPPIAPF